MGDPLEKKAFDACNKTYSEENEETAVKAVREWLDKSSDKVGEYKKLSRMLLEVASEKGYPKVVRELLKDEELVEVELLEPSLSGLNSARKAAKDAKPSKPQARPEFDRFNSEESAASSQEYRQKLTEWKRDEIRYTSCYNMLTLYMYIGEEITDALDLIDVISALRDLGWMSMDDIADHWDKVRDELREEKRKEEGEEEGTRMAPSLLAKLSEARYNYNGSWHKHLDDEDQAPIRGPLKRFSSPLRIGFAIMLSLLFILPHVVLDLIYGNDHRKENQLLFLECYLWLVFFGAGQIFYALVNAPFTGWAMIKEASRDTDLGATLKGSMNMQGLVSTFLFSTILGRLQVGLDFDLVSTNNATQVSTPEVARAEYVLQHWCAKYACDL